MSDVSRECKLSQIYTNHSIRVTGCTVLTRCDFPSCDIMSVSGHKSVQSLAIYQKTKHNMKVQMGKALFDSLTVPEEEMIQRKKQELPSPQQLKSLPAPCTSMSTAPPLPTEMAVTPRSNAQPEIIPFEANFDQDDGVSDLDLLSALCNVGSDYNNPVSVANTVATSNIVIPKSMFANCQIGTINFNITKK